MATCTFFGHRDCPESVKTELTETLTRLITEDGFDRFLVGNHGRFDAAAYSVLCELRKIYGHITVRVVLAYMPTEQAAEKYGSDTVLPEGIEAVPKRYAIIWRNKWMIAQSDCVVTCITRPFGGAAQFAELAQKVGKRIINISDKISGKPL